MARRTSDRLPTAELAEISATLKYLADQVQLLVMSVDALTEQLEWRNNRDCDDSSDAAPPQSDQSNLFD